jgi:DNA-binding transcriptional MerR regulator
MAIAAAEEGTKTRRDTERRVPANDSPSRPRKALTIGAVAKILGQEFDDISISKIRYLEDQKLLAPRRTAGGYRLYSQADVERLRAILRMQRDEFLPLRVIRQELASGDFGGARRGSDAAATRRAASVDASVSTMTQEEILDEAGVSESLIRELQEFGIVQPDRRDGRMVYDETDLEIVRAALLQQIVGPALRSRSQARRKEAIENLESLAAVCGHLKHLMLVRDLRRIKGD